MQSRREGMGIRGNDRDQEGMKRRASDRGRTRGGGTPCCTKVGLKRGPWTPEEDEVLASYVKREGEGKWRTLPKRAGLLRCGKSCRLRWMNYLRPTVKRGQIEPDEEDLILRLHRLLGNRWSLIAGRIPGRTDNEIKNYWNTHISKKLVSQGIDPRTHRPLNTSNLHNTPSTTTTTTAAAATTTINNGRPALTTPNPSPVSAHETNLITNCREIAHGNQQLDHMLFHYLDGGGSNNEGLAVDCFPDDMSISSYINSFMDIELQQQQQKIKDVNENMNDITANDNNNNNNNVDCNTNYVMAPADREALESPLPAYGDENFWANVVPSATHDQFMDFDDHFN